MYSSFWTEIDFDMDYIDRSLLNFVAQYANRIKKLSFRGGSTMCESCCEYLPEILSKMTNVVALHVGGNRYLDDGLFLATMPNLRKLNVSSCANMDGESVAQVLGSGNYPFLETIRMVNVPQISRWQIQQMCAGLPSLQYLDATGSAELSFMNVTQIWENCPNMRWFTCEPMNAIRDMPQWHEVVVKFKKIALGHSFLRQFPHRGRDMLVARMFQGDIA